MNENNKFYLEANIEIHEETAELKELASKVITLPSGDKKQPDLLYFSAIFVSSGENLNHAYFMGSELVAAEGTIVNKALDVEHEESEIIGHIYERAFTDKQGNPLDLMELSSKEKASLDNQEMHVAIAGIVYRNRFPNLAQEVADNKWKVSMECLYKDFDIKVGSLVLDKKEAESLGMLSASIDDCIGKMAKVIKAGKEIASGEVARVLRGICFSGCGIVKHPANPPSVIMETANEDKSMKDKANEEPIILDYDKLNNDNNNLTSNKIEEPSKKIEEARDGNLDDYVGVCIYYKRFIYDNENNVVANDWCSLYEASCTSFSRDTTDPDCLRNQELRKTVASYLEEALCLDSSKNKRKKLLSGLKTALREAEKNLSR